MAEDRPGDAPNQPPEPPPIEPPPTPPPSEPPWALDRTGEMPAVGDPGATTAEPGQPQRWSARARVPTPEPEPAVMPGWEPIDYPPSRNTLIAVLITACVMLLLAVTGVGIWLAVRGRGSAPPTPAPLPTVTSKQPPTSAVSSSAPPPATTPVIVVIPDLTGLSYDDAAAALTGLGLKPARVDEPSKKVAPGTVIRTDPGAGSSAVPGITVTVFVAEQPSEPSPSPPPSPSPS